MALNTFLIINNHNLVLMLQDATIIIYSKFSFYLFGEAVAQWHSFPPTREVEV